MPPHRRKPSNGTPYRQRRHLDPSFEGQLQGVIGEVATGQQFSLRKAAKNSKLPKSTVSDRASGRHGSMKEAHEKRQLLSKEQEKVLIDWCGQRAEQGEPWTIKDLREQAEAVSGKTVGAYWHRGFLNRNPEVKAAKSTKLDPKRAKNFNKATIDDYFDKLEAFEAKYPGGIPAEHKWNMDEKGIQMGGGKKNSHQKFLYPKKQKHRYRIQSDNLELATILECVSAAGARVPPSFVLQDGAYPNLIGKITVDEYSGVYFTESGWTDTLNFEKWVRQYFIPFAIQHRVDINIPIVLYCDGHDTHEAVPVLQTVYDVLDELDVEVVIICFPSKCTHRVQPLDVGVFNHVEREWQKVCQTSFRERVTLNRHTVIPTYVHGTQKGFSNKIIESAFKKTGIHPLDRSVFVEEDFAPAQASSTSVHVPASFPTLAPSSDPVEYSEHGSDDDDDDDDEDYMDESRLPDSDTSSLCSSDLDLDLEDGGYEGDVSMQDSNNSGLDCEELGIAEEEDPENMQDLDSPADSEAKSSPFSGILSSISSMEDEVIHATRSSTTGLDLLNIPPPKIISQYQDSLLSPSACLSELRASRELNLKIYKTLGRAMAQLTAANAHCTSIHRELEDVRLQLENVTKKKERGSTKIKARFLTSRELEAQFRKSQEDRRVQKEITEEKNKQKEAERVQANKQILEDAKHKNFSGKYSGYKRDDIRALAMALAVQVGEKDTIKQIAEKIDKVFEEDPSLKDNPRYVGMFQKAKQTRTTKSKSHNSSDHQDTQTPGPSTENLDSQTYMPNNTLPPNHAQYYYYNHIPSYPIPNSVPNTYSQANLQQTYPYWNFPQQFVEGN